MNYLAIYGALYVISVTLVTHDQYNNINETQDKFRLQLIIHRPELSKYDWQCAQLLIQAHFL